MPQDSLQLIFRTTALAKLMVLYAAPAWWGFANSGDMNRLEAFLRTASKSGYYTGDFTITALCEQADEQLFRALKYNNPIHPLHHLLPSEHSTPYLTRSRVGYIITNYRPKTAALTSTILFTACCTRTAISILIFSLFRCLAAVCLLFQ